MISNQLVFFPFFESRIAHKSHLYHSKISFVRWRGLLLFMFDHNAMLFSTAVHYLDIQGCSPQIVISLWTQIAWQSSKGFRCSILNTNYCSVIWSNYTIPDVYGPIVRLLIVSALFSLTITARRNPPLKNQTAPSCCMATRIACSLSQLSWVSNYPRPLVRESAVGSPLINAFCYNNFQVVEAADVLIEVLDARDPIGCRCPQVGETFIVPAEEDISIFRTILESNIFDQFQEKGPILAVRFIYFYRIHILRILVNDTLK